MLGTGAIIAKVTQAAERMNDIEPKNEIEPTNEAKSNSGEGKGTSEAADDVANVKLSKSKYPESTKHIADSIKNGQPDTLTIDRSGAKANRKASLQGIDKVPGADLDEYPPAMFKEGGAGSSVRPINPSDNRGAGSTMGHQLRPYPDGTKVKIELIE